jgi:hypothetical protein
MPENYVLLERTELNASAASVTFANIPQTGYTDLKIVYSARTNVASTSDHILMQFNGSTSSLSGRRLVGNGSAAASYTVTTGPAGQSSGNTSTANTFGSGEIYIPNYAGSTNKSWSADGVSENNATSAAAEFNAGLWSNTAAITSIKLIQEVGTAFLTGSTFSLYGIAALGTTPAIAPKADGGNIIATDGTYWYHAFTSSGTFTPQVGLTADCLVVAGGGSGGQSTGGGGGAGGYQKVSQTLSVANYAITVGAGASVTAGRGANGSNSSLTTLIVSTGGGGGGTNGTGFDSGLNGGSGGGASGSGTSIPGGTGIVGQGKDGGTTTSGAPHYGGSGGGGAIGVGGNGTSSGGANGGAGSNSESAWASATSTGVSGYYAGGGGGGMFGGGPIGSGGAGGGGAAKVAGTANTGGGGGGATENQTTAAAGGSGIVIIRYPIA